MCKQVFGHEYLLSLVEEITYILERCWSLRGWQICDMNALSHSQGGYGWCFSCWGTSWSHYPALCKLNKTSAICKQLHLTLFWVYLMLRNTEICGPRKFPKVLSVLSQNKTSTQLSWKLHCGSMKGTITRWMLHLLTQEPVKKPRSLIFYLLTETFESTGFS